MEQTQRELVGIIVHLGQRVVNDPVVDVSSGVVINQKLADLLRVEDELAKGLEVRLEGWFWDFDLFLGFPGPFGLCLLVLVVPKRTFCNDVKNALYAGWLRLTYRSTCICLKANCQNGTRCEIL